MKRKAVRLVPPAVLILQFESASQKSRLRSTRHVYVTLEGQPKGAPPLLGNRLATANNRAYRISAIVKCTAKLEKNA